MLRLGAGNGAAGTGGVDVAGAGAGGTASAAGAVTLVAPGIAVVRAVETTPCEPGIGMPPGTDP
jgi:hypothetical protein